MTREYVRDDDGMQVSDVRHCKIVCMSTRDEQGKVSVNVLTCIRIENRCCDVEWLVSSRGEVASEYTGTESTS